MIAWITNGNASPHRVATPAVMADAIRAGTAGLAYGYSLANCRAVERLTFREFAGAFIGAIAPGAVFTVGVIAAPAFSRFWCAVAGVVRFVAGWVDPAVVLIDMA
jgi:hypothetical protein